MIKSSVLIALALTAIAFLPAGAAARPITVTDAQNQCNGPWKVTTPGVIVCAWCEIARRGKSACHWIACDETGCDRVDISERKLAPAPLRRPPRPVTPDSPTVFGGQLFYWR